MNRTSKMIVTALFANACALQGQDANPISTNFKQSWNNVKGLLTRMAEKMPEENYRFKPTPDVEDFGRRMAHVATFNMRGCALVKGDQKTINVGATPSKAEVIAAMKEANDECDSVFNSLTDAELLKTVNAGRGGQRPKFAILQGLVLEHSQEVYGYAAVYMRMKGIVPPSSDRNER
jgi:hypothetical protein